MNKFFAHSRDGFISLYFLGVLIYVSSLCLVLMSNDVKRLKTITNLKKDQEYFLQEAHIIKCIKDDLQNWNGEEELEIHLDEDITITDHTVQVYVYEPLEELIVVTYDDTQRKIVDYQANRYIDEK